MNQPPLPEDPRDWPDDPFTLLGVDRNVDDTTLRRAYSRRIRQYKPEQSPAEFQRIRDAYEKARRQLRWRTQSHAELEGAPSSGAPPAETSATSETTGNSPSADLPELRLSPDPRAEVRLAWKVAGDGDWSEAARQLAHLALRDPDSAEIANRVHWLRVLRPSLHVVDQASRENEPPRLPPTRALRARFLERMRDSFELAYSAEAEVWWTEALAPWERMAFLRSRWWAAANRSEPAFDRIDIDLDAAREMFRHDPHFWFQALVRAAELSCLGRSAAALQLRRRAEERLKEERHQELPFSRLLERLDLARALARSRTEFAPFRVERLMRLAMKGLLGEERDLRDELVTEIVDWQANPIDGLEMLDRVAERHPAFACIIRDLTRGYAAERGSIHSFHEFDETAWLAEGLDGDPDLIDALNRSCHADFLWDAAAEARRRVLAFCLREGVRLPPLLERLREKAVAGPVATDVLCERLRADASLDAVIDGCLALWHVDGEA